MAKSIKLGAVQTQIMGVLWERGEATAKEVTDELSKHEPIAHSTIQTLLRQLEGKEAITHKIEGRTFIFQALIQQNDLAQSPLDALLGRMYGGSLVGFVAHFIKSERISPEELRELKKLIDEHEARERNR